MRFPIVALAAAGLLAAAMPSPAQAYCRGCGVGIVGGLAAGVIVGSAIAAPRYYGPPAPVYVGPPAPVYVAPPEYVAAPPPCRMEMQQVWDGAAWRQQQMQVCY
jgi:hypothetical protein